EERSDGAALQPPDLVPVPGLPPLPPPLPPLPPLPPAPPLPLLPPLPPPLPPLPPVPPPLPPLPPAPPLPLLPPLPPLPASGGAPPSGVELEPPAKFIRSPSVPLKRSRSTGPAVIPLTVPLSVYCQNFQAVQPEGMDGQLTRQFAAHKV